MMYVDRTYALECMYYVNKETRKFLKHNYIAIQNGFINDGLIVHEISLNFKGYEELERLYF
jgi:predicted solute-binding protein